jgi:hypothetical protein
MVYSSLCSKFRALNLKVFENHLSPQQFSLFKGDFSRITKMLQIEEDIVPFTEDKPHSWTRDGLPDIEDMNTSLFHGPAPASMQSIPAPGGVTLLTSALGPGSASISTLLPASSRLPDGSSGPATPPASPPLTGLRWSHVRRRHPTVRNVTTSPADSLHNARIAKYCCRFFAQCVNCKKIGPVHERRAREARGEISLLKDYCTSDISDSSSGSSSEVQTGFGRTRGRKDHCGSLGRLEILLQALGPCQDSVFR